MASFMVLGLYFFSQRHFTLAALAETAGALIKFIPKLILPIILIAAVRQINGRQAQLDHLLMAIGLCDLTGVAAYLP